MCECSMLPCTEYALKAPRWRNSTRLELQDANQGQRTYFFYLAQL